MPDIEHRSHDLFAKCKASQECGGLYPCSPCTAGNLVCKTCGLEFDELTTDCPGEPCTDKANEIVMKDLNYTVAEGWVVGTPLNKAHWVRYR